MTERLHIKVSKTRQIIFAGYGYALSLLKGKSSIKYGDSSLMTAAATDPLPFTVSFSYIMYQADQRDTLKTH